MADSPPLYGGRSATLPCGQPRFTSGTSNSLPRHPTRGNPHITRGRSASTSPMRVTHAESGRHVSPPTPPVSPTLHHLGAFSQLSLSLPHSLPSPSLSSSKPWRSSPIFPTIEAPPPRRSTTGGRRRTTPTNCTTPISSSSLGRSFPNKLLPLLHSLPQAQARRTTPSYSKPSPTT